MASKSSPWGAAGWWIILVLSIPFGLYAAVFVIGDFEVYKKMTITWAQGKYDTAGLNILHHIRAWQIHALAAEVFISTGLFQFSPTFRRKYPQIHRVMGYIFVAAGVVSSFTGVFFLVPNTEFGRVAQVVFSLQAFVMCYFLLIAVQEVKKKKFQVHQRYMIRAAATGYAIITLRLYPGLFKAAFGVSWEVAMDLSSCIAPLLFLSVSELYIQRVLLQPKVRTSREGVQSVQTSPREEPEFIPDPNSNEIKELRTKDPQAGWMGEQTHLGSSKSGGWVGGDILQGGGAVGGGCEPKEGSNNGNKSGKSPIASATWRGGHHYWTKASKALAIKQQFRTTYEHQFPGFGSKCDQSSPSSFPLCFKVPKAASQVAQVSMGIPKQTCKVLQPTRGFSNPTLLVIQPSMKLFNLPVQL